MVIAEPIVAPSLAEGNWKGITGFMKLRGKACSERLLLLGTRPETAAFIPSSNLLSGNGWNKPSTEVLAAQRRAYYTFHSRRSGKCYFVVVSELCVSRGLWCS